MNPLKGKVALVTGGMRGIGKAIVMELAQQGSDIVVCDIDLSNADQIRQEIQALNVRSLIVQADISVVSQVDALVEQALKAFGHIDILVNNAGITRDNLLMRMNEEEWDKVIQINLKGAFLCTKKVIRGMMKQREGKIINISSVVGLMGNAGQANYAASKGGLIAFGRSIAKEVASRNIQVNTIAPGYIETEMTEHLPQEIKDSFLVDIPAGRPGRPDDIAKVVSFLASPASDYVTGEVICVDGGMLIK
ncbi:3-oxoacyl-[acyl-carrier-protein] reductase [bacterium]|nr:3-oxoacyl-[acyl-carrier-protein] reductase [bacterium]